ncbi:hypothetical protein [Paenibacillus lactis]|uniref:Amidase n=1 Tax=Paenibacillus lactis TaxID=228574 RepID=A0ABS4F629_9BACL|nr:hypothetical protein [Paenibacillus lactis]MBP1891710.1 hypothetical protein [Paenibacillus lactis]MCM3494172.1 hypothetical protein [Paenibacillus lactis]HAF99163.1 hypothetical protein [Paenibacillus lactis]
MKKHALRFLTLCLACGLLMLTGMSVHPGPAKAQSHLKATWLWHTSMIQSSADDIIGFASRQGVNLIYLQMNQDVRPEHYRKFIRLAGENGIQVHVLGGASNWALESERHRIDTFLNWTAEYQADAAPEERFTGIHVDIEPHTLPQWKTDRDWLVEQWQSNVRYLVSRAHCLDLPVGADITFWLHTYSLPDQSMTISRWMIGQFDQIAIMAYRDTAANIYNLAAAELKEADALGKEALIAVETKSSNEGEFITFYEEGVSFMEEQLLKVDAMAGSHSSFSGVAIHEYRSWRALYESGR